MSYLADLLNQSNFRFYFLVADNSLDIDVYPILNKFHSIYFRQPDKVSCPHFILNNTAKLLVQNSGNLLAHPNTIAYINQTQKTGEKVVIVPFKPSAKVELICTKNNWIYGANQTKTNRLFEDKIKIFNLLSHSLIPLIPSAVDHLNQHNFEKYQEQFGDQLVIQSHFGWAGNSTWQASGWDDIKNQIPNQTLVKFSPLLKGYTLTNNCCLTHQGLIQSPPALQLTGLKPLTQNPFATVGRQWPAPVSTTIKNQVTNITLQFSKILTDHQYQGFFGIDFFVCQDKVYFLECNPRLTASFAFYTQIEMQQTTHTPMFFIHLAQFSLAPNYHLDIENEKDRLHANLVGSQFIIRNSNGKTIKKIDLPSKQLFDSVNPILDSSKLELAKL